MEPTQFDIRPSATPPGLGIFAAPVGALRWLAVFALVYGLAAFVISPADYAALTFVYVRDVGIIILFLALALGAAHWFQRPRPFSGMVETIRLRGKPVAIFVVLSICFLAAFTTFKLNIPNLVPFYADRQFAMLDEWLHGGDPWRYLHAVDPGWFAPLAAMTYARLWFFEWFGIALYAGFYLHDRRCLRYLWALALTICIIGTLLAAIFSSVGPVLYDRFLEEHRFSALLKSLAEHPANRHVSFYADYLYANFRNGTPAFGTGISAMPSVHVAIATLNALFLASLDRWLGAAGWIFAFLILLGSVYTGWHYALDGYLSMLVVGVIWQRTRFLADSPVAPEQHPPLEPDRLRDARGH